MGYKIMVGNFKGGTGKTTNSCLFAYTLAIKGYKTLVIDLDPQSNATNFMFLTKQNISNDKIEYKKSFMKAIKDSDLEEIMVKITDQLYILPSSPDFRYFGRYLEENFRDDFVSRGYVLNNLLKNIERKYDFDYIIIDTPPTLSEYTDNAVLCSDGVVIVMQTHERSLEGAITFVEYLQEMYDTYKKDFDIIGILPVMNKRDASTDLEVLHRAVNQFGKENLFDIIVPHFERLKRWDLTGIKNQEHSHFDIHDERTLSFYDVLTDELINRINKLK